MNEDKGMTAQATGLSLATASRREEWRKCPACAGKGSYQAFADGHNADGKPWGDYKTISCRKCNGVGLISPEHFARTEQGRAARMQRMFRGQSIMDAAIEKGCSPSEISRYENGDAEPELYASRACAIAEAPCAEGVNPNPPITKDHGNG
jgi:RecJ-like exonuclease